MVRVNHTEAALLAVLTSTEKKMFCTNMYYYAVPKTALHALFRAWQKPETVLWVFPREVELMSWFPVAFLTNDDLKVTHGEIELTIPVLWVRVLNRYTTAPLLRSIALFSTYSLEKLTVATEECCILIESSMQWGLVSSTSISVFPTVACHYLPTS